jgi:hypothetical protein
MTHIQKDCPMPRRSLLKSRTALVVSLALMLIAGLAAGQVIAEQNAGGDTGFGSNRTARPHGAAMGKSCPIVGMATGADTPAFGDGRIAFLKAELAVTEAQAPLWSVYAEALKRNFENMKSVRPTIQASIEGRSPMERMDAHMAAMESRVNSLKELRPSLKAFYEALSPAQRRTADAILTGMGCMI